MRDDSLLSLLVLFVPFSLVAVGGGSSVFAGIQHQTVDVYHWLDAREFVHIFAIARAAPGPGSMLSTLVGWEVAGWPGALVATLALFLPSSILCYGVVSFWKRFNGRRWHRAISQGLAPVGGGLVLAGVAAISKLSSAGYLYWMVVGASGLILILRPQTHPVLLFIAGAITFALARNAFPSIN